MPRKRKLLEPAPVDPVRFVAARVRQLRDARGLSQEALAAKAAISGKYVGEIERAVTSVSVATLWKICDGLGVTIVEFFLGDVDDDAAVIAALLRPQPAPVRRRVVRIVRAAVDDVP